MLTSFCKVSARLSSAELQLLAHEYFAFTQMENTDKLCSRAKIILKQQFGQYTSTYNLKHFVKLNANPFFLMYFIGHKYIYWNINIYI